jgi:hypothetical protein
MSQEQNKWADAVAKLIKLTQDDELKWRTAAPSESRIDSTENLQGAIYIAEQAKSTLRLYKLRFKEEADFMSGLTSILRVPAKQPAYVWVDVVRLELIDLLGTTLFTFPGVSGLKDLYSSVSYQVAGVEELLNELLSA